MLPVLTYMFVVALIFAIVDGFAALSTAELLILLAIGIVSIIIDHTSGIIGAKYGGAHTKSLLWGIAGMIVGTLLLPPLGSFIGLFVGVFFGEIHYKKSDDKALKAAGGALLGTLTGVIVNIFLSLCFIGAFVFFVLR